MHSYKLDITSIVNYILSKLTSFEVFILISFVVIFFVIYRFLVKNNESGNKQQSTLENIQDKIKSLSNDLSNIKDSTFELDKKIIYEISSKLDKIRHDKEKLLKISFIIESIQSDIKELKTKQDINADKFTRINNELTDLKVIINNLVKDIEVIYNVVNEVKTDIKNSVFGSSIESKRGMKF